MYSIFNYYLIADMKEEHRFMEVWCGGRDLNPGSPAFHGPSGLGDQKHMNVSISCDMKGLLR
ncbi:MAG: hypothetical protein DRO12_06625 [Thermoprotei archaeon]|nr:MAG: hypothetical protein DRO12_06625 [Thermoprotei archaeon]